MKKNKHIFYWGVISLLLFSCTKTKDVEPDVVGEDGYSIEVQMMVRNATPEEYASMRSSDSGAVLRAVGTEPGDHYKDLYDPNILNENEISRINIFIFDASGSLIKAYKDEEVIKSNASSTTDGTYKRTVKIAKADVARIENKGVKIIAIANANATGDITRVNNIADLQAKFEQYTDLNKEEKPRSNFLMDGMLELSNITWGSNKSFTVSKPLELKRALAKIRLRIDKVAVKDFQNGIETPYVVVKTSEGKPDISVKLMRYTNATSLVAGVPYAPQSLVETAYRLMPERTYPGSGLNDRAGNFYGSYPFYAGESSWVDKKENKLNPKDETYLMLRIKLIPKTPKEGDTGNYYYYRLPINYRKTMDGVWEKHLHKIERNYLYDVLTTIEQLGSLDEGSPVEVKSNIALQPWPVADFVDGTITQAHYLVVKEHYPVMANVSDYKIAYISDLPVEVKITEAFYEYYDQRGDYYKVVFDPEISAYTFWWYGLDGGTTLKKMTEEEITAQGLTKPTPRGNADGATVVPTDNYIKDGLLNVSHAIPVNFVPFQIKFTVTQIDPSSAKPLSENVYVTQYPPLFVTGRKSPGLKGGKSYVLNNGDWVSRDDVDFRFHTSYGTPAKYQGKDTWEAQRNDVNNRITVKVPNGDFNIGNPVDGDGYTRDDEQSNKMVSPEFIISSQYGMTNTLTPQRRDTPYPIEKGGFTSDFAIGYGPYLSYTLFPSAAPYLNGVPSRNNYKYHNFDGSYLEVYERVPIWRYYSNAEERCHEYFEGEYGRDGVYEEHYRTNINGSVTWATRRVKKEFKYKGSWRVPTLAEVKLIDEIQDNNYSVTKNLMYGKRYWTAQRNIAYLFPDNEILQIDPHYGNSRYATEQTAYGYRGAPVRCIFDTYMHNDDKGLK